MLDFLVITILILLITRWLQMKPFYWKDAGIAYSIPIPIFGSMTTSFFKTLKQTWADMYTMVDDSKIYGFHFFGSLGLLVGDPNVIKKFTITDSDSFMSHGFHTEEEYDPMAKGLFFSNGEQWKVFRGKMTPYFTPSRIKGMLPLVHPIADDFTHHVVTNSKSGPVDVHTASMKFTVDVIMSTVFGLKPDSFENPNSFFYGLQRELISFSFGLKSLIGVLSPKLYGLFGLTVLSKGTTDKMKELMSGIINQRLEGIGNRPDFVQGMVELMQKEEATHNHRDRYNADGTIEAKFDRFGITGQCMLMYAAGTETTGNTITFLLYELALNQDIQDTVRQEIVDMIARTKGDYSYEDLHSLEYVNMVVKETLRKYPILPVFARRCTKKIEFNGVLIPVGTFVVIPPICLHHDTKYFSEPEKFIPERFSDESNIIPGSYLPFGMGPRTCIGMKLAQTEISLVLCKLLPKYRLTKSSKTIVPVEFSINPTLSPKNGMWLNVQAIK